MKRYRITDDVVADLLGFYCDGKSAVWNWFFGWRGGHWDTKGNLIYCEYKQSEGNRNRWNNGIHIDCGGEYQFSSATNWRGSKAYYYTCDKCGHTEEFSSLMR